MMLTVCAIVFSWVAVIDSGQAGEAGVPRPTADPRDEVVVRAENVATRLIVYVQHRGPYWSVGSAFAQVRDYMAEHELDGKLFVRYLDDPTSVAGPLAMEVGFFPTVKHLPTLPFQSRTLPSTLVATALWPSSSSGLLRRCRKLKAWVGSRGFEPVGTFTEVHGPALLGTDARPGVVLEMPIRLESSARNAPASSGSQVAPPDVVAAPGQVHTIAPLKESNPQLTPEESSGPAEVNHSADSTATERAAPRATYRPALRPTTRADRKGDAVVESADSPQVAAPSVTDLLRRERFEELAVTMLPDAAAIPAEHQVWLGQLVFRITAIGSGVQRLGLGGSGSINALTTALGVRYQAVAKGFARNPLSSAVVAVDARSGEQVAAKRAIMQDLDRLLARIATRSVDELAIMTQLQSILTRCHEVLRRADS